VIEQQVEKEREKSALALLSGLFLLPLHAVGQEKRKNKSSRRTGLRESLPLGQLRTLLGFNEVVRVRIAAQELDKPLTA
jgi:hypothetical protein